MVERICVASCPGASSTSVSFKANSKYTSSSVQIAYTPNDLTTMATNIANANANPIIIVYETTAYFGRVCLPSLTKYASLSSFSSSVTSTLGAMDKYTSDLITTRWVILGSMGIALVVGFIYLLLLRVFAGVIVFITIISYLVGLVVGGYLFYLKGTVADSTGYTNTNMTYVAYAIWGVAGLSALMFCCFRAQLRLGVAIVKTAGVFVNDVKSVLIVPIIGQLLVIIFFIVWAIGLALIYSTGTVSG